MNLSRHEKINKFITDYITPIFFDLDFDKAWKNYKKNKREYLRTELKDAGVFKSLQKLESEGTSWEKIWNEMQRGLEQAKYKKQAKDHYKIYTYINKINPDTKEYIEKYKYIEKYIFYPNFDSLEKIIKNNPNKFDSLKFIYK